MKLFTIGDSISQGFMSGGAAKPQFCYNTLIADVLDDKNYNYLQWEPEYHLKVDLELILRTLEKRFGSNIRFLEWVQALRCINEILDTAEDYFERGEGKLGKPIDGVGDYFHSVAVEGMDVADSWLVTPNLCKSVIDDYKNKDARSDNFFGTASDSFYRNAYRVLNPKGTDTESKFGSYSALRWLDHHSENEGIENLIIWLGANNALGTIINLDIKQSKGDGEPMKVSRVERQENWNLWHPDDFRLEYQEMMGKVDQSMRKNNSKDWKVFVGNVPLITIAPVIRGLGERREVDEEDGRKALYFQYYSYFPIKSADLAKRTGRYLKFSEALYIDKVIKQFNKIIDDVINSMNTKHGSQRYYIVDICKSMREMAWKRNFGKPTYKLPSELEFLHPQPNAKYYHCTRSGKIESGGFFSLDGVHPSQLGQGLIAWEFLKIMKAARPGQIADNLKWKAIAESDSFLNHPIRIMEEIYEHDKLIQVISDAIRFLRD